MTGPAALGRVDHLLLLGAHCDDIVLGCGGTVLQLCEANPGLRVSGLVLCGGGSDREAEERMALADLCAKAELDLTVLDLLDGRMPAQWTRAKEELETLRKRCDPNLILAPAAHDAHQDHRTLATLVPTVFRAHQALGYEILKWDSDLEQPNLFVSLPEPVLADKIDILRRNYGSQHDRTWFDDEAFRGLARVRGVQSGSRYAEAFHAPKVTFRVGAP